MLRGIPLMVLALSVAVVAGYIEVYVEGGPDLDGLHIYCVGRERVGSCRCDLRPRVHRHLHSRYRAVGFNALLQHV
jgi:hypothetical protein